MSAPNSDRYGGTPTAMGITAITGTTTPMSLTVFSSDMPPVVDIVNVPDGQTVYGTIPVEVSASDDNGVTRVELYVDTDLKETLAAPPFSFLLDTYGVANGAHTVRAVAYDTILQAGSDSVAVTMDNIFPPLFLEAEKGARAEGRGLWRDTSPTPPWEWRHRHERSGARGRAANAFLQTVDGNLGCAQ